MPSELDLTALKAEVELLNAEESHRWQVRLVDGQLKTYVHLKPLGSQDAYCLRLDYGESLGAGPPSVTFCHPESLAEGNPADWPANLTDYFKHPPNNGTGWICNEWTREGRQHHSEWNRPWKPTRTVWRVMTAIQDILDRPGNYQGRNR